jgi:hypothetical protein
MKALISTIEPRETGYRVSQVEEQSFPVAEPIFFWVDCDNTIVADRYWFDPSNNSFKVLVPIQSSVIENQPSTTGTQSL